MDTCAHAVWAFSEVRIGTNDAVDSTAVNALRHSVAFASTVTAVRELRYVHETQSLMPTPPGSKVQIS